MNDDAKLYDLLTDGLTQTKLGISEAAGWRRRDGRGAADGRDGPFDTAREHPCLASRRTDNCA